MRKIDLLSIEFGKPLPADLFDSEGNLLLPKGHVVGHTDLRKSRNQITNGVFTRDDDADQFGNEPAPTDESDDHSSGGEKGHRGPDSKPRLKALFSQEIVGEEVGSAAETHLASTLRLDALLDQDKGHARKRPASPNYRRLGLSCLRAEAEHAAEHFGHAVDEISNVLHDVERGKSPSLSTSGEMIEQFASSVSRDPSLGPLTAAISSDDCDYLVRHGLTTSLHLMTVVSQMDYSPEEVVQAGIGAMFQDIGMIRVPRSIRLAPRALSGAERRTVERHPIYSVDMLDKTGLASPLTLMMGYQAHERCDQSGYPRRQQRDGIHPLARILAVIDVYSAVTSDRPHRKGIPPYDGILLLLEEAQAGRLDGEAVRLFLNSVSLFPLGSYVELSSGSYARVLRSNWGNHTMPVVVMLDQEGQESDVEVDLSKEDEARVVRTIDKKEVRKFCEKKKLESELAEIRAWSG